MQKGKVIAICTGKIKSKPKRAVDKTLLKVGVGIPGDAHAKTYKEISLLSIEAINELNEQKGIKAKPGSFAENITTKGVDLMSIPLGTKLKIGEALIEIIQKGKKPSDSHSYSYKGYSLLPTKGIFAKVIKSGYVKVGDEILVGI